MRGYLVILVAAVGIACGSSGDADGAELGGHRPDLRYHRYG